MQEGTDNCRITASNCRNRVKALVDRHRRGGLSTFIQRTATPDQAAIITGYLEAIVKARFSPVCVHVFVSVCCRVCCPSCNCAALRFSSLQRFESALSFHVSLCGGRRRMVTPQHCLPCQCPPLIVLPPPVQTPPRVPTRPSLPVPCVLFFRVCVIVWWVVRVFVPSMQTWWGQMRPCLHRMPLSLWAPVVTAPAVATAPNCGVRRT